MQTTKNQENSAYRLGKNVWQIISLNFHKIGLNLGELELSSKHCTLMFFNKFGSEGFLTHFNCDSSCLIF